MPGYGTVAKMRIKPGHFDDVMTLNGEWERDFKPNIKGAIAGYTYRLDSDPNTIIICAVFESKEAYIANADNPEQDKWYRRFREHLEADPEWMDGEVVSGV